MRKINLLLLLILSLGFFNYCSSPKPVKTTENLKTAYIAEATAGVKYITYAQKAKEEGFNAVASLFEAAARAENIHAANLAKTLEKLGAKVEEVKPVIEMKATKENLLDALNGENNEISRLYPEFISVAKDEKCKDAVKFFTWAMDTEKKHHNFFQMTLTTMDAGDITTLPTVFYVCPACGNTWDAASVKPECEFCQTKRESYIKF